MHLVKDFKLIMIYFPHCKINIGLQITNKRSDGFHDIETIFYPVAIQDALEFVEAREFQFTLSGIDIEGDDNDNLVVKAYNLLKSEYKLPPLHIHLHKHIPSGAGLGGGSSDAAFMLSELNEHFDLKIKMRKLMEYALQLGSDCPFFINPVPSLAKGRGEILEEIEINLSDMFLAVIKPPIHISTAEAYKNIVPKIPEISLAELIKEPIEKWKNTVHNQFEDYAFSKYPEIQNIKDELYNNGATFALMSGSGSAVYGIFRNEVDVKSIFPETYEVLTQEL